MPVTPELVLGVLGRFAECTGVGLGDEVAITIGAAGNCKAALDGLFELAALGGATSAVLSLTGWCEPPEEGMATAVASPATTTTPAAMPARATERELCPTRLNQAAAANLAALPPARYLA